jgi:hypothetical protein
VSDDVEATCGRCDVIGCLYTDELDVYLMNDCKVTDKDMVVSVSKHLCDERP